MKNNEKISIQDLIDTISQETGFSKKKTETFLRSFQSTIEEGLEKDRLVKIKGLGSFRLTWNAPRKSVNVQTGGEYIIPGHNKVSFSPEASLRDLINEPYAHLKTTQADEEKAQIDPLRKLNEQAEEIVALMADLKSDSKDEESAGKINENVTAVEQEKIAPTKKELQIEEKEIVTPSQENNSKAEEQPVCKLKEREIPVKKKRNGRTTNLIIFIIFLILLFVAGYFLNNNTNFIGLAKTIVTEQVDEIKAQREEARKTKAELEKKKVQATESQAKEKTQPKLKEPAESDKPKEESAATPSVEVKKEEVKSSIFEQPRSYDTFIATERINKGTTLTILAEKYYKHKIYWVYIYEANKGSIKNPNSLSVGMKVKIPQLPNNLIDTSNPKTIEYAKDLEDKYAK